MTAYGIDTTKKVLGLKGILASKINSSDINILMNIIQEFIAAAEARLSFKEKSHQLKDQIKTVAQNKIKIDVTSKIVGITKDALTVSSEINQNVSRLHAQLAGSFAGVAPSGPRESEAQIDTEALSIADVQVETTPAQVTEVETQGAQRNLKMSVPQETVQP